MEFLSELFSSYTLRVVALGAAVLGIISGALGAFAVLRKQSLLGDALSHAALPGIVLAFIITSSKAMPVLVLGAAAAGWIATLFIFAITRYTKLKDDTALGIVLSVFFGFGLVLLSYIQKTPRAAQAGLEKFLFGQAAAMMKEDVFLMAVIGIIVLVLLVLFWKEFKLTSFDPDFAKSMGISVRKYEMLLTSLLVISIVIGLQTVGVVLMSAMVVAPAAAARQWTDKLSIMVLLSAFFGAAAGVSGAVISSMSAKMPTGPTIVLSLSSIFILSMIFAPARGIVWGWLRELKNRRAIQTEAVLEDFYLLDAQHGGMERGHTVKVLRTMSLGHGGVERSIKKLQEEGFIRRVEDKKWVITPEGSKHIESKNIESKNIES